MVSAIHLGGTQKVTLKNVHISGFHTGITSNGATLAAENVTFDNVMQPWNIRGGEASITGTRIKDSPRNKPGPNKSQVGWEPSKSPPIPAKCPNCGAVFPSRNYSVGSSYFYSRDNEETCPVCGNEHAKLAEGIFDLSKELVGILLAPDVTRDMLIAIQTIVREAANAGITPQQMIERLEAVKPGLSSVMRKAGALGSVAVSFISLVFGIASYYVALDSRDLAQQQVDLARDSQADSLLSKIHAELSKLVMIESDKRENQNAEKENRASEAEGKKPEKKKSPPRTNPIIEKTPAKGGARLNLMAGNANSLLLTLRVLWGLSLNKYGIPYVFIGGLTQAVAQ